MTKVEEIVCYAQEPILWPWRDWMTIGIGVLAYEGDGKDQPKRPNHLVLISDTLGSYGDAYSHDRLHKLIAFTDNDVYGVIAGAVDRGAELMPLINMEIAKFPIAERTHGLIIHAITFAAWMYKVETFIAEVLPRLRLPPESFDPRKASHSPELEAKLQEEWESYDVGFDLIVGAFDHQGQALLYSISGEAIKPPLGTSFPGLQAIGTGADNAKFWLSYRRHVLNYGVKRAIYHAYEAKLMADKSPHVNEHLDIAIAKKGKYWGLTSHRPEDRTRTDAPVNLSMLEDWYKKFGPQGTGELDG